MNHALLISVQRIRFFNHFKYFLVEYQEIFGIFDNRGDGKVQMSQIGEVLRACGQNPTESEWRKYVGDDPGKRERNKVRL